MCYQLLPLAEKDKRRLVMGALGCVQEEDSSHPDYLESIMAITLLLGRSVRDPIDREYELECMPRKSLAYIRRMEQDYKGITRLEITVAVQRLKLIYCRGEQKEDGFLDQSDIVSTFSLKLSRSDISKSTLPVSFHSLYYSKLSQFPNLFPSQYFPPYLPILHTPLIFKLLV